MDGISALLLVYPCTRRDKRGAVRSGGASAAEGKKETALRCGTQARGKERKGRKGREEKGTRLVIPNSLFPVRRREEGAKGSVSYHQGKPSPENGAFDQDYVATGRGKRA